jgi:hypothetical protein
MKEEELINKLNNASLPQIKLKTHQENLRRKLLNSDYFEKPDFFEILKKSLVFGIPASVVLVILGVVLIQPKLNEAEAIKIAKDNPAIKEIIEQKKMMLGEVKIKNGTAYVLLSPPQNEELEFKDEEKTIQIKIQEKEDESEDEMEGAVIEIELDKKKVKQINPIKSDDIYPLAEKDLESAKNIVDKEEIIKDILPKERKIDKIESSLPLKMKLKEENNEIKVVPDSAKEDKKANIYYSSNGKKWVVKVNLFKERVEEIRYSLLEKFEKGRESNNVFEK